jgi:hypothetical protein
LYFFWNVSSANKNFFALLTLRKHTVLQREVKASPQQTTRKKNQKQTFAKKIYTRSSLQGKAKTTFQKVRYNIKTGGTPALAYEKPTALA